MAAVRSMVLFLVGSSNFRATRSVHGIGATVENEVNFFEILL
jgi:hypothetical protein